MNDEHGHDHDHEHEHEHGEELELEIDTQSQIFLAMRQQNLELLKIVAQLMNPGGASIRPENARQSLKTMWEVYSELYSWIDPEESDEDEEE